MSPRLRAVSVAVLALCLAPAAALAQGDTAAVRPPATPRQVLSVQPIQLMLGVVSGDYERAIGSGLTAGIGASYWDLGTLGIATEGLLDVSYLSAEAKVRYYPGEVPFRGFSIGLTAGGAHASYRVLDEDRGTANGVKVGAEVDYNWLLGRSERLALALGLGGKRIWYGAAGDRLAGAYPTSRVAIGWAF
jgi:hypothetical protein